MKTLKSAFAVLAVILAATLILTACAADDSTSAAASLLESTQTRVVIRANATGGSLEKAMAALSESGELTYEGADSEYGFYLISVNGYVPDDAANEYWAIYTTLGEYEGVEYSNAGYGTYDYNGETYASASYGVSGIPMVAGEVYILVVATY